jgi:hypothetical protein
VRVVLFALAVVLACPQARDAARVAVRPPLLLLGLLVLGAAWSVPRGRGSSPRPWPPPSAWWRSPPASSSSWSHSARSVRPELRSSRADRRLSVVTCGPYHWSRNPIYVSFVLLLLGVALWANSVWIGAMLVPFVVVLRYGVIAREEAYLDRRLGEPYRRYKVSVRRWL